MSRPLTKDKERNTLESTDRSRGRSTGVGPLVLKIPPSYVGPEGGDRDPLLKSLAPAPGQGRTLGGRPPEFWGGNVSAGRVTYLASAVRYVTYLAKVVDWRWLSYLCG